MNKILLASTALVLSAGLAHAQAVTITGEGRMGIQYDEAGFGTSEWRQENRLTLNFNVSVEADHGLTFGAWSRARMQVLSDGTAGAGLFSGSRVWVESNGLKLTFGNQDGAIRGAGVAMGYAGGCGVGYEGGYLCLDAAGLLGVSQGQNSTGSDDEPMVRIDYTMGSTRVALSHARDGATEFGIRSTFDAFTVAAGYTNGGAGASSYTISGRYNGGSWGAALLLARIGGATTNWSLQGNVALGGGNVYGFVGEVSNATVYGLNYGYGLGGGATVMAGVEHTELGAGRTTASVGVAFTF
ncbi:porin [Pararhodobacter zhoushanensis]|uniref:Porin n=1 Tax=Pararhodobacter zhoushanensis TaxID=2479545 RepID=A0ABT3GTL1_9RHOB|nr:porin [Pararhodobacter zhoushanensis]MCW1930888.1 porin [Pararhodobacter zhoushanensis]